MILWIVLNVPLKNSSLIEPTQFLMEILQAGLDSSLHNCLFIHVMTYLNWLYCKRQKFGEFGETFIRQFYIASRWPWLSSSCVLCVRTRVSWGAILNYFKLKEKLKTIDQLPHPDGFLNKQVGIPRSTIASANAAVHSAIVSGSSWGPYLHLTPARSSKLGRELVSMELLTHCIITKRIFQMYC